MNSSHRTRQTSAGVNKVELTLQLPLESADEAVMVTQAQNRQEVAELMHTMARSATQTGNLCMLKLDLNGHSVQLLLTVNVAADGSASNEYQARQPVSQPSNSTSTMTMTFNEHTFMPDDLHAYVEQALRDYHFLTRLAKNPLVALVDLKPYGHPDAQTQHATGVALRNLLDEVITMVTGVAADQTLPRTEWRLDHYLHLRYRENIKHKELASWMGYTERHLLRLRKELVTEAVELIVQQLK